MAEGYDAILAVDVGGTNIRTGVVMLNLAKKNDLSKARIHEIKAWRHGDEDGLDRDDAVGELGKMLKALVRDAADSRIKLAPAVGIGVPGLIGEDGGIERGGQILPGNWESSRFNLPKAIRE